MTSERVHITPLLKTRDRTLRAAAVAIASTPRAAAAASADADGSIRRIAQTSLGGRRVRLRVSNAYGRAMVARTTAAAAGDLEPGTMQPLTFRGQAKVTMPVRSELVSVP